MPVNKDNFERVLNYHGVNQKQLERMENIRKTAKWMVAAILDNAPTCADQQAAIRLVREAMMTANVAVVLEGEI